MTTSTLSPKYQIVIPKKIRQHLQLKPGQKFQFSEQAGEIVLRPVLSGEDLIGFLKADEPLEFEREADREL